jgi:hypothetical protein
MITDKIYYKRIILKHICYEIILLNMLIFQIICYYKIINHWKLKDSKSYFKKKQKFLIS